MKLFLSDCLYRYFEFVLMNDSIFKDKAAKATMNETVVSVIEAELFDKSPSGSVESLNEAFLKEHSSNYVCLVEGVKVMYQLDTANNQKKALDILTEMDTKKYGDSLSLKVRCIQIFLIRFL